MNITVDADTVISWEPCYEEDKVRQLLYRPFTIREILTCKDGLWALVPEKDRLWVVLRTELIPAEILHTFACDIAEMMLLLEREGSRKTDIRSWEAIRIKRLWIKGEATDKELQAARIDAMRAMYDCGGANTAWASVSATMIDAKESAKRTYAWSNVLVDPIKILLTLLGENNDTI